MVKNLTVMILALTVGLFTVPAFAADVSVKWQDPAKFTDIDPADQDKDKFEAHLFKSFDNIFAELARELPENYHWQITVTDLDLAGEVRPRPNGQPLRKIESGYRPAITFEYKLMDSKNVLVKQDTVDLKDPTFLSRSPQLLGVNTKPFPYEEYMIRQWFDQQQYQKVLPRK
ncbi:hypothetical protein AAKU58_000193 [Oxalobacteraceae bacterium GrIS 1.18]